MLRALRLLEQTLEAYRHRSRMQTLRRRAEVRLRLFTTPQNVRVRHQLPTEQKPAPEGARPAYLARLAMRLVGIASPPLGQLYSPAASRWWILPGLLSGAICYICALLSSFVSPAPFWWIWGRSFSLGELVLAVSFCCVFAFWRQRGALLLGMLRFGRPAEAQRPRLARSGSAHGNRRWLAASLARGPPSSAFLPWAQLPAGRRLDSRCNQRRLP